LSADDISADLDIGPAIAVVSRIARKHVSYIDEGLTLAAKDAMAKVGAPETVLPHVRAILWGIYLGHVFGHFEALAGSQAAAAVLRQLQPSERPHEH
jgi:hypothetical protein